MSTCRVTCSYRPAYNNKINEPQTQSPSEATSVTSRHETGHRPLVAVFRDAVQHRQVTEGRA